MKEKILTVLFVILWLGSGFIGVGMETYYDHHRYSRDFSGLFVRCCGIASGPVPLLGMGAAYLGDWVMDEETFFGFKSPFKFIKI